MSAATPRRPGVAGSVTMLALAAGILLAATLWGLTFWHVGQTAGQAMTAPTVQADVVACSPDVLGPGCTVAYADDKGVVRSRTLDRPGLIGTSTGEHVPLWIAPDDTVGVAGWRAWVDALILLGLSTAMTSGAVRWFHKVLRQGDPLSLFDLGEDTLDDEASLRDAG